MARLDSEMVARGLARSRERAKEMIRSGSVTVNGKNAKKPSDEVLAEDMIETAETDAVALGYVVDGAAEGFWVGAGGGDIYRDRGVDGVVGGLGDGGTGG